MVVLDVGTKQHNTPFGFSQKYIFTYSKTQKITKTECLSSQTINLFTT